MISKIFHSAWFFETHSHIVNETVEIWLFSHCSINQVYCHQKWLKELLINFCNNISQLIFSYSFQYFFSFIVVSSIILSRFWIEIKLPDKTLKPKCFGEGANRASRDWTDRNYRTGAHIGSAGHRMIQQEDKRSKIYNCFLEFIVQDRNILKA